MRLDLSDFIVKRVEWNCSNEHLEYTLEEMIIRCQCSDCTLEFIRTYKENIKEFEKKLDELL